MCPEYWLWRYITIVNSHYSNYVALKVHGTLQTKREHRSRQYQYSTLSFSTHCWFPVGSKSGKWSGNSLWAPTQSLFWFPTEKLGHWNLCQIQGFLYPSHLQLLEETTGCIQNTSIITRVHDIQAITIKSQDKISQKAVYAIASKNTKKCVRWVSGCLFSWERLLIKCADF